MQRRNDATTQAQAQAQEEGNISFFLRLRLCLRRPGSHVRFLALALMLASLRRTCEPAFSQESYQTMCITRLSEHNFLYARVK